MLIRVDREDFSDRESTHWKFFRTRNKGKEKRLLEQRVLQTKVLKLGKKLIILRKYKEWECPVD
jgi:hypothetical protein